ncbi:unnamed protein product [Discula destructiva]
MRITQTVVCLLGAASLVAAVPAIDVRGNYFVNNATGDRYQIVGVAYQPGGSSAYTAAGTEDPLSSKDSCLRDAALMQLLGINAIRIYNVNPNINHDDCASVFNAAGMYMFIDVNSPLPGESINSGEPWTSYYAQYLNHTFAVVEAFKNYPNTAAFFAGNEVISDEAAGALDPPYIRAVIRDLKSYIAKHVTRSIPVGYSAADVRGLLFDTWSYLQCSDAEDGTTDDGSRADLFALNSYSWCGNSSFTESTYDQLVAGFSNSSIPIFFSEYGCNTPYPRVFTEVPVLYSDQMSDVFSGGIVFEYTQGTNNYGLVNVSADGSAQLLGDFYALKNQFASLNFTDIQGMAPPSNSPTAPACSSNLIMGTNSNFTTDFKIPNLPPGAQDIIEGGVTPAPIGKIVTINDYTVTQTIKDSEGNILSGLKVVPLADDQINQPGSNTQSVGTSSTSSGAGGSGTDTGSLPSSSPSDKSAGVGVRYAQDESIPFMLVAIIAASFAVGLMG